MANTIRIKRRATGAVGAPTALANAELAFNEVDNTLYYGKGTGGAGGTATTVDVSIKDPYGALNDVIPITPKRADVILSIVLKYRRKILLYLSCACWLYAAGAIGKLGALDGFTIVTFMLAIIYCPNILTLSLYVLAPLLQQY